jgi:RNA polymerase sigma-70 factor, ECF subfamily
MAMAEAMAVATAHPRWPAAGQGGQEVLRRRSEALEGRGQGAPPEVLPAPVPGPPTGGEAFDEPRLLYRVRQRDERALAALYDRYAGLVYAVALRIVGDRHLAEEVLQDTFFRCWDEVARFDPARGRLSSWLLGVARNRAIDLLRSRQHQARLHERESLDPGDRQGDPGPRAGAPAGPGPGGPASPPGEDLVLLRETVTQALDGLPLAQRQAISLAYYGGLTQSEIATLLGIPLGTVKTRIRDGMERLRRTLRPLLDPDLPDLTPTPGPQAPQVPRVPEAPPVSRQSGGPAGE